jgi:hypothetical protein
MLPAVAGMTGAYLNAQLLVERRSHELFAYAGFELQSS